MNWIIFIIIFIKLLRKVAVRKKDKLTVGKKVTMSSKVKQQLVIAITLSLLFGLGWGVGIPATNKIENVPLRAILQAFFIFLTGFQGVFVFIMHCVRSEEARSEWKKWFKQLTCQKASHSTKYFKYSGTGTGTGPRGNVYGTLSTSASGRSSSSSTLQWAATSETLKRTIEEESSVTSETLNSATEEESSEPHIYDTVPESVFKQDQNPHQPIKKDQIPHQPTRKNQIPRQPTRKNQIPRQPTSKDWTMIRNRNLKLHSILEEEEETEMNETSLNVTSSFNNCAGCDLIHFNSSAQDDSESDEEFSDNLRMFGIVGNLSTGIFSYLIENSDFWRQSGVEAEMEMDSIIHIEYM